MMEQPGDSRFSYLAPTWARLVALKAARDPLNLFRALDYAHPNVTVPLSIHDALLKPFAALAPAPGPRVRHAVARLGAGRRRRARRAAPSWIGRS